MMETVDQILDLHDSTDSVEIEDDEHNSFNYYTNNGYTSIRSDFTLHSNLDFQNYQPEEDEICLDSEDPTEISEADSLNNLSLQDSDTKSINSQKTIIPELHPHPKNMSNTNSMPAPAPTISTQSSKTLSQPSHFKNYHCAHSCMQGHRDHMEDDYAVGSYLHYNLYAVFDGHCGDRAAKLAAKNLFKHFKEACLEFNLPSKGFDLRKNANSTSNSDENNNKSNTSSSSPKCSNQSNDCNSISPRSLKSKLSRSFSLLRRNFQKSEDSKIKKAMIKSLESMDQELFDIFTATDEEIYDGCTCVWLIHDTLNNKFHVANLGDSRCLISVGNKKIFMTKDHKPSNDDEMDRIYNNGGFVMNDRVNANLALSRALGDFEYKMKPYKSQNVLGFKGDIVSRVPDVSHINMDDFEEECLTEIKVLEPETKPATETPEISSTKPTEENDETSSMELDSMTESTTSIKSNYKSEVKRTRVPINILLACDGVFDVFDDLPEDLDESDSVSELEHSRFPYPNFYNYRGNTENVQDLVNLINKKLNEEDKEEEKIYRGEENFSLDKINELEDERLRKSCQEVMLKAFDLGSTDNISVMLINLR